MTANKVYIVERAERLYPALYANRFDGLHVELVGSAKKSEGKFVWIEPTSLQATR